MAHCPYEKLADLEPVLEAVRALGGLREAKPGIFYIKSDGFLHFHIDRDGNRCADVKRKPRGGWVRIPVPARVTAAACRRLAAEIAACHKAYLGA